MTSWWEALPRPLRRMRDLEQLASALTDLERSPRFHAGASRWSLTGMRRLHRTLGRPLHARAVVHVAGSKGKGSVCLLLEAMLRAQGLSTGVYLSPHVDRWNERMRLDGRDLATRSFLGAVQRVLDRAHQGQLPRPTFFETLTAAAFLEFERSGVDVAVVETGIGGRLDCTNVLPSAVALVTAVEREHRAVLGSTLSEIAREKAGIFRRGAPGISGIAPSSPAANALRQAARECGAALWEWGRDFTVRTQGERFLLGLPDGRRLRLPVPQGGPYAGRNAALAVVALERLAQRRPALGLALEEEYLARGLRAARLPGRCERVSTRPAIHRDGAHTPGSLRGACRWLKSRAPGRPLILVLGMNRDKEWRACLRAVKGTVGLLIATPVPGDRSRAPEELAAEARRLGIPARATDSPGEALAEARARAGSHGSILVAGSFWLAGSLRSELQVTA